MKPLDEYRAGDWARLRPLTHGLKTMRYGLHRELHVRLPQRGGATDVASRLRGRRVLVTVAYNDPEVIELQAQAMAKFVPHALYIIADNSIDDVAAGATASVAARFNIPYVRLPHPWSTRASRSHGLALNWIWRNLIRPGEPEAFGFLDADLFPTVADDPFAKLDQQPIYGMKRKAGQRWYLWAGFCLFRFDAVKHLKPDFGQDWFNGLDTGGGLWRPLYSRLEDTKLVFADFRIEPYERGADPVHDSIHWCDGWLHECGQTKRAGRLAHVEGKRRKVKQLIAGQSTVAE